MPTGKVTYYTQDRGFGFIKPDDGGPEIFVHANNLVNAHALARDWRVSFETIHDDRRNKPKAAKVRILDASGQRGLTNGIEIDNHFLLNS